MGISCLLSSLALSQAVDCSIEPVFKHSFTLAMASTVIKNVIVIGASGSVGPPIVSALLEAGFHVSVLTRTSSKSMFPVGVTVHRGAYSDYCLLSAFDSQDAVVSTIATVSVNQQISIIDAAIKAGVKRFFPSEYGIDTSLSHIPDFVPPAVAKQDVVKYLKTKESAGMSWTALCVGGFFDWSFKYPGLLGCDLPGRKLTIFDGGNAEFEMTNIDQIGRAVAASLQPDHLEETKNVYVYVNSFTMTQNRVFEALQRLTGDKFEATHVKAEDVSKIGLHKLKSTSDFYNRGGGSYAVGSFEVIITAICGYGGFNNFSKTRGLWNQKLGLPEEDFEETMVQVVHEYGALRE
jgi:nucleoside-diphosphate-sugar epimerase